MNCGVQLCINVLNVENIKELLKLLLVEGGEE